MHFTSSPNNQSTKLKLIDEILLSNNNDFSKYIKLFKTHINFNNSEIKENSNNFDHFFSQLCTASQFLNYFHNSANLNAAINNQFYNNSLYLGTLNKNNNDCISKTTETSLSYSSQELSESSSNLNVTTDDQQSSKLVRKVKINFASISDLIS